MDCSPPCPSVHGIFQARRLEWVAISSSRRSSQPRDRTQVSCIGRQILSHCVTREAHILLVGFKLVTFFSSAQFNNFSYTSNVFHCLQLENVEAKERFKKYNKNGIILPVPVSCFSSCNILSMLLSVNMWTVRSSHIFLLNNFIIIFGCAGSLQLHGLFSTCRMRASHSDGFSWGAQAQQMWLTGLVAVQHVGLSQIKGQTRVSCSGRWSLDH